MLLVLFKFKDNSLALNQSLLVLGSVGPLLYFESLTFNVLYYIVSIHLYSDSWSAHQSEALPVRETQREESSLERTKRGTWLLTS